MPRGQGMHGTNLFDMSDWKSSIWFSSTELFAACWDLSLFLCMRHYLQNPAIICSKAYLILPSTVACTNLLHLLNCLQVLHFWMFLLPADTRRESLKKSLQVCILQTMNGFLPKPKTSIILTLQKKWNFTHSKDKNVLVPKPKTSILLTSTYLIFELWNSHTTDNSLEPEPKSSILLASFLIFSFVKFTHHRHCSGTKIHWQRSCTGKSSILPHWIKPDFQGMKFTHHRQCGCTKIQKDPRTWVSSSRHSWCASCERNSHLEDKCSCAENPRAQLSSSHHSLCSSCERKSHPADNCSC